MGSSFNLGAAVDAATLPVQDRLCLLETLDSSHPGVDRIESLNEPSYIPYTIHVLSTSGWL